MSSARPRLLSTTLALPLLVVAVGLAACAQEAERNPLAGPSTTSTSTTITTAPTTTTVAPPTTTVPVDVHALRPPTPAGDPAGLAAQITAAETTLRDPAATTEAVATAALSQQVAYRQLGSHPEWDAAVLAYMPAHLHWAVQHHATARREFRAMHKTLSTTLPPWRIIPPEPADLLLATYVEAEQAFGIPWSFLAAIHLVETGTGRIRGTSTSGAQGPMQFLPATWAAYGGGGDINSTRDSIFGAARYLAANGGASGNLAGALWNYNHSDFYVRGVTLYAEVIGEHPQAFRALYHWGVWYLTAGGEVFLPVGYDGGTPPP